MKVTTPAGSKLIPALNSLWGKVYAKLLRWTGIDMLEWKDRRLLEPSFNPSSVPQEAAEYLRQDNPRLKELMQIYRSLAHPATDHSRWTDRYVKREINLQYFRGDNAFVWQYRDKNTEVRYVLTAYYIQDIDKLGLLRKLGEDDLFGIYVFDFNGELMISRDLLDSVVEIYFLERNLGLSRLKNIRILDIGAGYGRLAHRAVQALPVIEKYFCVDSVAASTFICEYYLRFRGVGGRARVVPVSEIENTLRDEAVDLAINVHSFSECTLAAAIWWLDILRKNRVRYLMIVPNGQFHGGTKLLSAEKDGSRLDLVPALNSRGYRLISMEPKYLHPSVQKHAVSPTFHHLFELRE